MVRLGLPRRGRREGGSTMRNQRDDVRPLRKRIKSSLIWDLLRAQKRVLWGFLGATLVTGPFTFLIAQQLVQMVDRGIVDQAVPLGGYVRMILIFSVFAMVGSFLTAQ